MKKYEKKSKSPKIYKKIYSHLEVSDGGAEAHPLLGNVEDHVLLVVGVRHEVDAPQARVLRPSHEAIFIREVAMDLAYQIMTG
jgi:hypothetical protein